MEAELLCLQLNYRGTLVEVTVDLETANILLNDPEQMETYIQQLIDSGQIENCSNNDPMPSCSNASSVVMHDSPSASSNLSSTASQSSSNKDSELWVSKGRPTERDNIATHILLNLRKKYMAQFDDRKTVKMTLWKKISEELHDQGFNVGRGKEGGIKCRQKFFNLTRTYLAHKKHTKTTGAERVDEPPFYNEMDEILGFKDKADPQNLQDSMDTESYNDSTQSDRDSDKENDVILENDDDEAFVSDTGSSSSTSKCTMKNRFAKVPKSIRPKNATALLLEEVKRQHKDTVEQKEMQFKLFEKHLQQRYDQNEKMLNLMEKMVESQNSQRQSMNNNKD